MQDLILDVMKRYAGDAQVVRMCVDALRGDNWALAEVKTIALNVAVRVIRIDGFCYEGRFVGTATRDSVSVRVYIRVARSDTDSWLNGDRTHYIAYHEEALSLSPNYAISFPAGTNDFVVQAARAAGWHVT